MRHPRLSAALLIPVLALGCRDEGIRHYRVEKPDEPRTASSVPGALRWALPEGWSESVGSGMRFATLKAPVEGELDISVVVLGGSAGGEAANINRWRGQIGLPPLDEAAVAKARKTVSSKAGTLAVFDFTSESAPKRRVMGGLLPAPDGRTWFLKMAGDPEAVTKARPRFLQLLGSLRLD